MNKIFSDAAWEDYCYWMENDRRLVRKINELLRDIERNGNDGIGKPEPLRYDLDGFWSRRINEEHRLIYSIGDNAIYIAKCRKHYTA
ncbi:MAG: Txe/YoeB family addiction module toxin [Synergistaceae bacterium]|nr:Txe/YoeB family addiction module toxin [Synergistaceae bacterium]